MTRDEIVRRALSQVSTATYYRLGRGGMDPNAPTAGTVDPATGRLECDCSGFANWCLGDARFARADLFYVRGWGGWINTTAMVADARDELGRYSIASQSLPGNLLVFPSAPLAGRKYGHVGVIVEVRGGHPWRVAHCSAGNRYGQSIAVTPPAVFERNGALEIVRDGVDL